TGQGLSGEIAAGSAAAKAEGRAAASAGDDLAEAEASAARNAEQPGVQRASEDGSAGARSTRKLSLRERYLGKTPGKKSKTGKAVIARMKKDGKIRVNPKTGATEFKASNNEWYDLSRADMAHKTDAVTWWNETGRSYGAKAPEVRQWMLNSDNYYLELDSINRSQGAILGQTQTYLPPLK
ncbi:HNH/ENDO VII family nuclease, partial [Jiella sp. CQZ9-1]